MLYELVTNCPSCGAVMSLGEYVPDRRAAERRVQMYRRRGRPLFCAVCWRRGVQVEARAEGETAGDTAVDD